TAPLPKRSNKLLWTLAALVVLQGLALGGYFMFENRKAEQARLAVVHDADQRFGAASKQYRDGDYPAAKASFEALALDWPEHPKLGISSTAYAHLAAARLAMNAAQAAMTQGQYKDSV